ncbi:two-component sensor histidine kinase [Humitalea rosea]|uniref:histidine kinase n=1 Tax=Humitalea rosea TaxID=990373 RepID=A0A2W7IWV9_9PROT|nr:HWE histidine kinase domain-containing protein [Humitalea rosea]PZW43183.1 two-component sensor histidine kinase [Humitalea rosea]
MTTPQPDTMAARTADRALIALLVMVTTLPLLLLALSAWTSWQQSWAAAANTMERAADAGAEYARRVLDGHALRLERANDLLEGLADAEIRARADHLQTAFRRIAGEAQLGQVPLNIFAFDRNAALLVGGGVLPVSQQEGFDERDYVAALRVPGAPRIYLSRVHVGLMGGRAYFAVSRRRHGAANGLPRGSYDGIIMVAAFLDSAGAALGRLPPGAGDATALIREDGEILARSGSSASEAIPRMAPDDPIVQAMARGQEHCLIRVVSPIDGVPRFLALRRVEGWPAYVLAGRPDAAVMSEWWQIVAGQSAIAIPAWGMLVAMTTLVWRRKRALAGANAALEARVTSRTAELTTRSEALAESEARLRLAQEAAMVGTWELDLATRRRHWSNEQFWLYGLHPSSDGCLGEGLFYAMVHPEDRALIRQAEARAREIGEFEAEFRILRPALEQDEGGPELRWLLSRGRIIRGRDGVGDRMVGVNVDITSRRLGEERRDLVAREVAHRARNALQLVLSAVRMTKADTVPEFERLLRGRICALSRAQAMLAESGGLGADLRSLAEGEVSTLVGASLTQVAIEGPSLEVPHWAVQPLSMALHEMTTNALKYGALSTPQGRVSLSWVVDEAAGLLRLRWAEADGPAIAGKPERAGFGTRVLEATLASQLGGRVSREWTAEGLILLVTLPLARVRRAAKVALTV